MLRLLETFFAAILVLAIFSVPARAQTGKIAGTVTDAESGEPLPGVNVVVEGTTQGATTNAEGHYTILNVTPGTYTVQASFVGYATQVYEGVRVNIDLTTTLDFELPEEAVGMEEVTVQAREEIVKPDVSANVANLSAESIENLPATSIEEVIGLQAGVQGMSVRGGDLEETGFVVDGLTYSSPRDNSPFTGVSYTSISEVQVQTGGFNAEYGNVRSGLVSVVTKEGPRDHYTVDVLTRYSPPQQKYDGIKLNAERAYWWRPFFSELPEDQTDDGQSVGYVGTHSAASPWDQYTRRQYPDFDGWNAISEQLNADDDPNNDLTPEQAREVALFRHRKDIDITQPDYELDGSVGGPVPLVSEQLGDLRFFASYRGTQSAYVVPQMREAYKDRTGRLKLTSNVSQSMKLTIQGMRAKQFGLSRSDVGGTGMWQGEGDMAYALDEGEYQRPIWAHHLWNPMDVTRNMVGVDFTHTLGASTFYEVVVQRMGTNYHTYKGRQRDTSTVVRQIGPMELDEAPFGYEAASRYDYTNMRLSGDWHQARDSSEVARWTAQFDLTSQLNQFSQLKTGVEFMYNNYVVQHESTDPVYPIQNENYYWERSPVQGAAYVQNKLEFEGMVANVGLRLDYFNPTQDGWYAHDQYERTFAAYLGYDELDTIEEEPVEAQWNVSPRLGLSFPVTTDSKLFFNYGHFRQMLNPQNLFVTRRHWTGGVDYVGNPRHPMPHTVSYELGYEHNLFDVFLLRVTGYYKQLGNQTRNVNFVSADGLVDYYVGLPNNYEDIRGVEFSLQKNVGRWIRGFANFTYMSTKAGDFGYGTYHENPVEQRQYERLYEGHYLNRPVPQPYARINVEFLTPRDFGPTVGNMNPAGDWRLNLLGGWRAGDALTWSGGGADIPGLENNLRWKGTYSLDMRLSKNLNVGLGDTQLFVDVSNVLGLRDCCGAGFHGSNDFEHYMQSLHLEEGIFDEIEQEDPYRYIRGDDKPGDFRPYDVEFVPIEIVDDVGQVQNPLERPLYYEWGSKEYHVYRDGGWQEADSDRVEQVLDDKAYIDMPNQRSLTFLNPRRVRFGLRITI